MTGALGMGRPFRTGKGRDMQEVNIPRGKYLGVGTKDGKPLTEADHFIKCSDCGGMIDCRDLGIVFAHEGPLPHPKEDAVQ